MDQSGFGASPWAAMLSHHAIGSAEHPGFNMAHAHNAAAAAAVAHHAHHGMPMDLHVSQGFPYYRYVAIYHLSNSHSFLLFMQMDNEAKCIYNNWKCTIR